MVYPSLRKNVLGLICLVITAVFFLAGLWPFNFSPENKVRWLQDQNGVQFYGQAIIYSTIPFFQSSNIPMESFSIEICLQPTTEESSHIAHIFSILDEQGSETFFVGQWRSHLVIEKRMTIISQAERYQKSGLGDVFEKGVKRFFTITSGSDGTKIYVDGELVEKHPIFNLFSGNESSIGQLVLGNSPTGKKFWTGNLLGLAFYSHSLTKDKVFQHFQRWMNKEESSLSTEEGIVSLYLFDEHSGTLAHDSVGGHHLLIPSRFKVLQKTILVPPWKDFQLNRSYLMDMLTNILGFIPFGFFLSSYLWMRKPRSVFRLLLMSIIIAGCLSLSIELTQVYLPTRSSQLMDIITNMAGTGLGFILFHFYNRKK